MTLRDLPKVMLSVRGGLGQFIHPCKPQNSLWGTSICQMGKLRLEEVTRPRSHSQEAFGWDRSLAVRLPSGPGGCSSSYVTPRPCDPLHGPHLTDEKTEAHTGEVRLPGMERRREPGFKPGPWQAKGALWTRTPQGPRLEPPRAGPLPPTSPGAPRPRDTSIPHPRRLQLKAPCELGKPFQLSSVYPGSWLPGPWASLGRWR